MGRMAHIYAKPCQYFGCNPTNSTPCLTGPRDGSRRNPQVSPKWAGRVRRYWPLLPRQLALEHACQCPRWARHVSVRMLSRGIRKRDSDLPAPEPKILRRSQPFPGWAGVHVFSGRTKPLLVHGIHDPCAIPSETQTPALSRPIRGELARSPLAKQT